MQEIELKFQVVPAQRAALAKAMSTASAVTTRLQAIYFDTPDRRLAKAGIALRLRKEGRRWVQTLKAGSADAMRRFEHNVTLPYGAEPQLDLQRHAGTPAQQRLEEALARAGDGVLPVERFRTDIRRVHRPLRVKGAMLELAFDSGRIVAGERSLPVCELEIELLRGDPRVLLEVARRWAQRFALWLDVRSKAEQGDRLARGISLGQECKAGASPLRRGLTLEQAWREAIRHCLAQILPNASDIAGASHRDEHVHQLRVGLRRLRSLLRFFASESLALDDELNASISAFFGALGDTRDRDVLVATLMPALQLAGAPLVDLPEPAQNESATERLYAPEATLLWLNLLAASVEPPGPAITELDAAPPLPGEVSAAAEPAVSLTDFSSRRLNRWHRRVTGQARDFMLLSDEERHTVRKRVKRLRYAAEFVAPLYPRKRVERYLERLRPLQDALGEFNDLHVAQVAYGRLVGDDGRAWFAVGWLTAQREAILARCAASLKDFAKARRFWKG